MGTAAVSSSSRATMSVSSAHGETPATAVNARARVDLPAPAWPRKPTTPARKRTPLA
jgi:hypothetical protein